METAMNLNRAEQQMQTLLSCCLEMDEQVNTSRRFIGVNSALNNSYLTVRTQQGQSNLIPFQYILLAGCAVKTAGSGTTRVPSKIKLCTLPMGTHTHKR